jgi:hypothetical protein
MDERTDGWMLFLDGLTNFSIKQPGTQPYLTENLESATVGTKRDLYTRDKLVLQKNIFCGKINEMNAADTIMNHMRLTSAHYKQNPSDSTKNYSYLDTSSFPFPYGTRIQKCQ